jgi:hypothetical protein
VLELLPVPYCIIVRGLKECVNGDVCRCERSCLAVLGGLRADDAFEGMRHVALNLGEAVRMSAPLNF